ncbi:MAG: TraR/DksA C4-type zinc finger protein [Psychromonas sp.]
MAPIEAAQLNAYKGQLIASLEKLRNDVAEILMRSNHSGHKMAAEQIQKIAIDELVEFTLKIDQPAIAHKVKEIQSIDASLNDIEMGLYGFCSDCEEEIELSRLDAAPATKRCETCEIKYQKQTYNKYKL